MRSFVTPHLKEKALRKKEGGRSRKKKGKEAEFD